MKQKERQERSKREIFRAAMEEFGAWDYDRVTMESICTKHGISKGMMYHYYSSKDELFLLCVEDTFQALREFVKKNSSGLEDRPPKEALRGYFMMREQFLQRESQRRHVFENVMYRPPKHLEEEISEIRGPIREDNRRFVARMVSKMELRKGADPEKASRYLESMESILPELLRQYQKGEKNRDIHSMMEATGELLDLILLGVLDQNGNN